jgi:hypothetical protein
MPALLDGARFGALRPVDVSQYHYALGIAGATRRRMSHFGQGPLIEINEAMLKSTKLWCKLSRRIGMA